MNSKSLRLFLAAWGLFFLLQGCSFYARIAQVDQRPQETQTAANAGGEGVTALQHNSDSGSM
jgi:hypothetical protein